MKIYVDVIDVDIPLLIELHDVKQEGLLVDYLNAQLEDNKRSSSTPVTYKNGHTFITWNPKIVYFTQQELRRLHLHFLHPTTNKRCNLLHRAHPDTTIESVCRMIEQIAISCEQ